MQKNYYLYYLNLHSVEVDVTASSYALEYRDFEQWRCRFLSQLQTMVVFVVTVGAGAAVSAGDYCKIDCLMQEFGVLSVDFAP